MKRRKRQSQWFVSHCRWLQRHYASRRTMTPQTQSPVCHYSSWQEMSISLDPEFRMPTRHSQSLYLSAYFLFPSTQITHSRAVMPDHIKS
ncbi:hypothetical protein I7I53_03970 [Histoplasma capsulatum var. duboisii H88]|uniref:Uncharacterized protein n=1 Tax=Ajellomyces capsulatus (strain H88) TaxID=544711 RepID=A0A8A1LTP0_AJEC8|nr:hypothetical protein I7I53_03970 [Histoplasma capsulatum var. duboisii H88]